MRTLQQTVSSTRGSVTDSVLYPHLGERPQSGCFTNSRGWGGFRFSATMFYSFVLQYIFFLYRFYIYLPMSLIYHVLCWSQHTSKCLHLKCSYLLLFISKNEEERCLGYFFSINPNLGQIISKSMSKNRRACFSFIVKQIFVQISLSSPMQPSSSRWLFRGIIGRAFHSGSRAFAHSSIYSHRLNISALEVEAFLCPQPAAATAAEAEAGVPQDRLFSRNCENLSQCESMRYSNF